MRTRSSLPKKKVQPRKPSAITRTGNSIMKRKVCKRSCFCKKNVESFMSLSTMAEMRSNYLLTDATIIASDSAVFPVHKTVLVNFGSVFQKAHLDKKDVQQTIRIDAPGHVVKEFINFGYGIKCNFTGANIMGLFDIASRYNISSLLKSSSEYLCANLTKENALKAYGSSKNCGCIEMQGRVKLYVLQNFVSIVNSVDIASQCSTQDLEQFIKDDELNVKEEQLFELLEGWSSKKQDTINSLLKLVRFSLMSPEYFNGHVENSKLTISCPKVLAQAKNSFLRLSKARTTTISLFQNKEKPRIPNEIVIAMGGWNAAPNGPTAFIETFDIRAMKWHEMKFNIQMPRAYHGLAVLHNKIYLLGGYDGDQYYNAMQCFDPVKKEWQLKAPMHWARCYVSVAVLGNCLYALGGFNGRSRLNSVECYDPATNQWTTLPPMHEVRSDASAVAGKDGKLYITGGFTGSEILNSIEIYDPKTREWTYGPVLNTRRSGVKSISVDDKIYVLGGFDGNRRLKTVECLKLSSTQPQWKFVAEMHIQRSNFTVTLVEKKILVTGGFEGTGVINDTELYDTENNKWDDNVPSMHMRRSALTAVTISGIPNASFYVNRTSETES